MIKIRRITLIINCTAPITNKIFSFIFNTSKILEIITFNKYIMII